MNSQIIQTLFPSLIHYFTGLVPPILSPNKNTSTLKRYETYDGPDEHRVHCLITSLTSNAGLLWEEIDFWSVIQQEALYRRAETTKLSVKLMAVALGHDAQIYPPVMKDIVTKARTTWLKNDEVLKVLVQHKEYQLPIGQEAPKSPGGLYLISLNFQTLH